MAYPESARRRSVRERLLEIGMAPMPMSVAEFATFFREDVAANRALAQAAGIPKAAIPKQGSRPTAATSSAWS
jgi:hypothetical protein